MMTLFSYMAMAALSALVQDPAAGFTIRGVSAAQTPTRVEGVEIQADVKRNDSRVETLHNLDQLTTYSRNNNPSPDQNPSQVSLWVQGVRSGLDNQARLNWTLSPLGRESDDLGATLARVEPTLRKQLQLPEHQGVIVTSIVPGGPAERVKLEANDILLFLQIDDPTGATDQMRPIEEPGDLTKHLKAVGEKPVKLKLMRQGEAMTLKVKPRYRVTLAPIDDDTPRYFIGVQANPVDEIARSHLKLPENVGLVVNEIVAGSPAETAGIEQGDILIDIADMPLADTDFLITTVQENGEKELTLKALRAGKKVTLKVKPQPRPATEDEEQMTAEFIYNVVQPDKTAPDRRILALNPHIAGANGNLTLTMQPLGLVLDQAPLQVQGQTSGVADAQIEALARQVEELKKAVEELKKAVEEKK